MGAPMILEFTAYGTPQPQGSAKAFVRGNRAIITSDNAKLKPYRHTLSQVAALTMQQMGLELPLCPRPLAVEVIIVWTLTKPQSTPRRVIHPTKKPDADKLCRAVFDSLTGIAFEDDSQVVRVTMEKRYGSPEQTQVTVRAR